MKNIYKFLLIVGALFVSATALAETAVYLDRNLKQGDSGKDVKFLQQFLNDSDETRISATGDGSPGKETDYFGAMTKNAVIRFQEKYREEILSPVGLDYGTGYVGTSTRNKINELSGAEKPDEDDEDKDDDEDEEDTTPKIKSIDPHVIEKNPFEITIKGKNFVKTGNSIIVSPFPQNDLSDVKSTDDGEKIEVELDISFLSQLSGQMEDFLDSEDGADSNKLIDSIMDNIVDPQKLFEDGGKEGMIPVYIRVQNENGTSNEYVIKVDMKEVLKNELTD